MNKIVLVSLIVLVSFMNFSCKKNKIETPKDAKYSLIAKTTVINWTAFKTNDKVPVKGKFNTINLVNNNIVNNPIDAINKVEFQIPINSIDTKNEERDAKLIKYFFNNLKNSTALLGRVNLKNDGSGTINLNMNGISRDFPVTYIISGQVVDISASINLDNWQTKLALSALNKACKDLHKGKDGISKTWSQVDLNIVTYLKVE